MDEPYVCYECGDVEDGEDGDGDICGECLAIAANPEGLMYGTLSDEAREASSNG